jgi:hypothetical protein
VAIEKRRVSRAISFTVSTAVLYQKLQSPL